MKPTISSAPRSASSASDVAAAVTTEGETFASPPQRIEYLPIEVPQPGEYAEVVPGILWLRIPMPIDLNHINLWLLKDGDGWTLVDTGLGADLCKSAWEGLEKKLFAERPLKRIFLTHLHPDHIGLAHWLQQRHQVPVVMGARGWAMAQNFSNEPTQQEIDAAQSYLVNNGYKDLETMSRFLSGKGFRSSISGLPKVSLHLSDGDEFSVDDTQWHIYETDGHAEGHQCLHDIKRGILISGDQVLPTISPNVSYSPRGSDKNPLKSFLDSLARLAKLDARTLVLPSHGRPFFGLQSRTSDLIAHHHEHLSAILNACSNPKTAFDLVPVIFRRALTGMHWMFAMGETIAHAEYLAISGELRREVNETSQEIRYRRVDASLPREL